MTLPAASTNLDAMTTDSSWDTRHVSELDHWMRSERLAVQQQQRLIRTLREDGCPWSVIGTALGISKQAAQQRFGRKILPA